MAWLVRPVADSCTSVPSPLGSSRGTIAVMRCSWTMTLVLVWLLAPGVAWADALSPPPMECPDGSRPRHCHGPSTCQIAACSRDGDCRSGQVCRTRSLCVRSHNCGGWNQVPVIMHVVGPCNDKGECEGTGGALCKGLQVCVPGSRADAGRADAGRAGPGRGDGAEKPSRPNGTCGCHLAQQRRAPAALLVFTIALLLFVWVRRRPPH